MIYLDHLAHLIREAVPPKYLPDANTDQLFRTYAVLLLAKGESVTSADVHNAWVSWICDRDPTHPSLIPFNRLPAHTASNDEPFVEAIRAIAKTTANEEPS